jgi:WD40 repeat protein
MPSLSSLSLPRSRNWQDFEDLCRDLWRCLWRDPETQKHGRSGQPQAGVDVYGRPSCGSKWVGVQCKVKGEHERLTRDEIEAEVEKAGSFAPALSRFVIATTAPSDVAAQEVARVLTVDRLNRGAFPVSIASWDEIQLDLAHYPDLVAKHYPQFICRGQPVARLGASGNVTEMGYRCLAPRPRGYVARGEYDAILAHLQAAAETKKRRRVGITTALRGAGGFGKTTLAQALCHDERVQAAYPDGVLWTTMGEQLTEGERLSRLRDLLRLWLRAEPPAFESVAAAGGYLRELLAGHRVLVVVDDVWSPLDLTPFRELDPASALLATTRDRRNLPEGCLGIKVDAMASEEAVQVLGMGLPGLPRPRLQGLAARLGEWALLLALVHRQLWERVEVEGLPPERALEEVEGILAEEGIEAFDRDDVPARDLAVGRTLNASLRLLSEDERRCFEDLAIFPEDAAVPSATLATLWDLPPRVTLEVCRRLDQLSLAARFDAGGETVRLHDVVRACLRGRSQGELPARQRRFLERFRPARGWHALPPAEPYLWRGLAYHLVEARCESELSALLLDFRWIEAKLAVTGVNALLADYEAAGYERELRLIQDALRLSAYALLEHPEELPGQLFGRLLAQTEPRIVAYREGIHPTRPGLWMRPMSQSLTGPGGALVRILTGLPRGGIETLAALPNDRIVCGFGDGSLQVWDLATGESERTLEGHSKGVLAVAALPNGHVLSSSLDGSLRLWDIVSGRIVRTFSGHSVGVRAIAALADDCVISGSEDGSLRVWDIATGETIRTLEGHTYWIMAVAALPDGRVVSGSLDGDLRVWDLTSGETVRTLRGHLGAVRAVAVLGNDRVISGAEDCSLRVWDLASGQTVQVFGGHPHGVVAVAALPDGRVVFGLNNTSLHLWDLAAGEDVRTLKEDGIGAVAALPNGRVVAGASDGSLRVWELATGKAIKTLDYDSDMVSAIALLPDGRIVSRSYRGDLRVWEVDTGKSVCALEDHKGYGSAMAVLADGRVICGSSDGSLSVRDLTSGETVQFPHSGSGLISAAAALSGNRVIFASDDLHLRVLDLGTGEVVRMSEGHTYWIRMLAVLSSGSVVSASQDGSLRVWDLATGKTVRVLEGHSGEFLSGGVLAVAALADGRVISGGGDTTLRVWDLATGETVRILEGHLASVSSIAVLPDGRVVSGSEDRTLRVWDLASGRSVARLSLEAQVNCIVAVGADWIVASLGWNGLHFFHLEEA